MADFDGKRIIITGASRGLGAVCAREFSARGAKLVLIARSQKQLEEVRSNCADVESHLSIPLDITDLEELRQGIETARQFLGSVEVVLHVAGGGFGLREPLLTADDFLKLFMVNLGAVAEINRLVVPAMVERQQGSLVHVASIASSEAVGSVGYSSVKAGLAAYVRTLGNYLAGSSVVATGILPGGFIARGNTMDKLQHSEPEIFREFIKKKLPRGFLAPAEEVIPLLLFLCSDDASMMGGCMVPIDAGEGKAYCSPLS